MTLKVWIIKTGPKKVAKMLNVDPSTVSSWKTNGTLPRPKVMVKINKLTKGRVSYREMIENAAKA